MRTQAVALLALAALAMIAAPATGREIDKNFHESFNVREGVTLRLEHGDGDVTIRPWDQDVIDVAVRYRGEIITIGFGDGPDFSVEFRETDDEIYVAGREEAGGFAFIRTVNDLEYTYTISAPSYAMLDLTGDDGDVRVTGWTADIDCALDDGDVELRDTVNERTRISLEDGDITIRALTAELLIRGDDGDVRITDSIIPYGRIAVEDGDVSVRQSSGDFEIDVDDGDVALLAVEAERVEVRSDDGDVDVELVSTTVVDVDLTSDDGDISLVLAEGTSVAFLVTMDDGRVDLDLPGATGLDRSEHRMSGEIYGGEGRVRIRTADGNIVLSEAP